MNVQARIAKALFAAREASGHRAEKVARAAGLGVQAVRSIEKGRSVNVPLRHVYRLAHYYGLDLRDVIQGHNSPGPWANEPPLSTLDDRVRTNMRRVRIAAGLGTCVLSQEAKVHQTWLVREESGEVSTLDLVRLERVANALEVDLLTWLDQPKP